jgi:hypothetical protein
MDVAQYDDEIVGKLHFAPALGSDNAHIVAGKEFGDNAVVEQVRRQFYFGIFFRQEATLS